jgi:hypothetical protein
VNTRWLHSRLRARARSAAVSRLFRDPLPNLDRSILLVGTARSGTTWLADILVSQLRCRLMFEPFHAKKVRDFNRFEIFHYMRPGDRDPSLYSYAGRVLRGEIRDPWIDSKVRYLRPRCRLIKEIRANLLLKWLVEAFPQIPVLFLMRHPCAVVLSRMEAGWEADEDIDSMMSQEKLRSDFLEEKIDVIRKLKTPEEKHAFVWCVHHLVPRSQMSAEDCTLVFYENLCLRPESEIPKVFAALGRTYDDSVFTGLLEPSTTSSPKSVILSREERVSRWQGQLGREQIDRILSVVEAVGPEGVYGVSPLPLAEA